MAEDIDKLFDKDAEVIDHGGEVYKLGCMLPPDYPMTLPKLEASQFRVWSKPEIIDAIKAKKQKRREIFKGNNWIVNQRSVGSCFPPGTLIRMADGSQKPIEQVKLLDKVLTAEGRVKQVIRTMVRPENENVYRVKVWGHRHLRATKEHPILTKRGYVAVGNLTRDDWVAIPRFMPQTVESIIPSEYVEKSLRRIPSRVTALDESRSYTAGIPGRQSSRVTKTPLPELIKLDRRFGRLVGLFLAEGSLSNGKVTLHFHAKEEGTLIKEVSETLKELFDVDTTVVVGRSGNPNRAEVKFYGVLWVELFQSLCAQGSGHKRLHPDLAAGPKEFLEGVLSGWQDGDGLGSDASWGGVTVSRQLAMNMYDIATAIGHRPTVESLKVKINPKHGIKSRQMRYIVKWPQSGGGNRLAPWSEQDETYVWRKVDKIEAEAYSGFVYNLEVADDHSYVAEGIGVHNCNAAAAVGALRRARFLRGIDNNNSIQLAWEFLYAQINRGKDNGSLLDEGMVALRDIGVCPLDLQKHPINKHIYKKYYTPEDYRDAALFQARSPFPLDTEEELATLVLSGIGAAVVAVDVNNSFMSLDRDGICGGGNGPGNHAVGVDDVDIIDGELAFDMFNSWDLSYGQDGRAYLTWKKHFYKTVKYHRYYAVMASNDGTGGGPVVAA